MKILSARFVTGFFFLLSVVCLQAQSPRLFSAQAHQDYVPGELLIKFKPSVSSQSAASRLSSMGVRVEKTFGRLNIQKATIGAQADMEAKIAELTALPDCEYAEPNYIYHILETPNDSRYPEQWALNNTGQTGGTNGADIDAPQAWDLQTGSGDILVGIIDTGVDYNHPDLQAQMWTNPGESGGGKESNGLDDDGNGFIDDFRGWDFANDDNDPFDDNEHGTHVAGIIGATGNNGSGVSGINWTVSLVGLKFLAGNGSGSTDDAVDAILYAIDMGIPILSNSWGGPFGSQSLEDAIEQANQAGILFVAASGNDSKNTDASANFPSNYGSENLISVASSDDNDDLSSFSNYGITTVDLAAPGSDILSTVPGNGYQSFSGTSMATPYVSGVAALVMAQFPGIGIDEVKYRLMGAADFDAAFVDKMITEGRLNAFNSLSEEPLITTVKHPHTADTTSAYAITSWVVDDDSITFATLVYSLSGSNTGADSVNLAANGLKYTGSIPAQPLETTITYFVRAGDNSGNSTTGRSLTFQVTANPPDTPGGEDCGCGALALSFKSGNGKTDTVATLAMNFLLFILLPGYLLKRRRKR